MIRIFDDGWEIETGSNVFGVCYEQKDVEPDEFDITADVEVEK